MQETKIKVFIDCDDVLIKSQEAVINIINKRYNTNKNINDLRDWNYRSIYKNMTEEEKIDIYKSQEFFDIVEYIEDAKETYEELKDIIDWKIITQGSLDNLEKKRQFLENTLSSGDVYALHLNIAKSTVNMIGAIQIDDVTKNLIGSSAAIKILYRPRECYWNEIPNTEDNFYVVKDWKELKKLLIWFTENPDFIRRCYD